MNRRAFVIGSGASLLAPAGLSICEQSFAAFPKSHSYAEEMPDMLTSYLASHLNQISASWDQKRALLQTATDVQARNRVVRENLLSMLGMFPSKKPLEAITVKTVEKDGYRVENIMFLSRPNFWVTGNLYIPTTGSRKFPAILSPCGHYPLARMTPQYQSAYISLAKNGFVVLGYDPIGQGERRQYWNPATGVTDVGGPITEHSMAGQLLLLLGENLTNYMVWDGMRAIDYLLTRSEVDGERIGCAGHSGGGTVTKFITVADPRIRCSVILEGGMANQWPTQSIGIADAEQNLFPAALYGIDNVDLCTAVAPRPLLVGIESYSAEFDRAADAVRLRYKQLDAVNRFDTVAADDPHAWTPKLRRATTDWFCRWFYGRNGPEEETAFETSSLEQLYCTPDGSLLHSHRGATIFSILSAKVADLPPTEPSLRMDTDLAAYRRQIRDQLSNLLRYPPQEQWQLGVRHIVTTPREGYHIEKIEFLSEPGIYIPVWVFVPEGSKNPSSTVLYLNDEGMQRDGMEYEGEESPGVRHGILDQLVRKGHLVVAADIRGIGATRPRPGWYASTDMFSQLFDMDTSAAYAAWSMGRSLLGMRVFDVVRCIDYVMQRKEMDRHPQLHVIGDGRAGLWCLYAAVFDERISHLICSESLLSYRTLALSDRYRYGADVFVPEILQHFDLPDIAAAIAPRPLALLEPKDAMKNTVNASLAVKTYQRTQVAYRMAKVEGNFRLEFERHPSDRAESYLHLIERMERK